MARASAKRISPGKRLSPSSQPTCRKHRDGSGFDAAVALVEIDVDFDLARVGGFEGGLDVGLQGRLVAFDGEQIVRPTARMDWPIWGLQAIASMVTTAP